MTLKRYVNGQVVPIKLSILDAFRTSPPPRKKKGQSSVRFPRHSFYDHASLRAWADAVSLDSSCSDRSETSLGDTWDMNVSAIVEAKALGV